MSPEAFASEVCALIGCCPSPAAERALADRIAERDRVLAGHYREQIPTLTEVHDTEPAPPWPVDPEAFGD